MHFDVLGEFNSNLADVHDGALVDDGTTKTYSSAMKVGTQKITPFFVPELFLGSNDLVQRSMCFVGSVAMLLYTPKYIVIMGIISDLRREGACSALVVITNRRQEQDWQS